MTCRSIIPFCSHTKGRRWIAKKLSRFQFWILGQICGPSDTSKESGFGIELSFFFVKMFDVECGLVHFSSVMRVFRWYLQKLVFSIHFRPIGLCAALHQLSFLFFFTVPNIEQAGSRVLASVCAALKNLVGGNSSKQVEPSGSRRNKMLEF